MKTLQILFGLMIGGYVSIMIFWGQYDNYQITQHNQLKVFNIEDIEKDGIAESRYIKIHSVVNMGSFVYYYNQETKHITKVIYPILSAQKLSKYMNEDNTTKVKVVVVDDTPSSDCVNNNNCIDINRTTIKGVTLVGWDSLDEDEKALLNSLEIKLEEDLIVLRLDSKPSKDHQFSFWMVLFALGILIVVILGFIGLFMDDE